MKCTGCNWNYPRRLLHQMCVSGVYSPPTCGICALRDSNRIAGIERESFQGEAAEDARQAAIAWRKTHPQDGPK